MRNLGFLALNRLHQRLKKKKEGIKIFQQKIILKTKLIIRESCIQIDDTKSVNYIKNSMKFNLSK
ncbi:hypothetical protein ES705_05207 [subsurface metagenome]